MKRLGLVTLAIVGVSLAGTAALADDLDHDPYGASAQGAVHLSDAGWYACPGNGNGDGNGDGSGNGNDEVECLETGGCCCCGASEADWWDDPNAPLMYQNFAGTQYVSSTYGYAVAVPVAPVVTRTWQYGWGVPSSRVDFFTWMYRPGITNTARYVEYPGGIIVAVPSDTAYLGYYYGRVPY